MNTNSRCKRNTARKYQKNRVRIAFTLRQPQFSLKHLDVSDLSCLSWYTTPLASRAMMFHGHFQIPSPDVSTRVVTQGSHYTAKD